MSSFWKTAELVGVVIASILIAASVQIFIVKPYAIPSSSMVPTLEIGDRVLVNRIANEFTDPEVGKVYVFYPPQGADDGTGCAEPLLPRELCEKASSEKGDEPFIKRLVAEGGDTLEMRRGELFVNGEAVEYSKTMPCKGSGCSFSSSITIPEGYYYMMGDNRPNSNDARFWGAIPRDWIVGEAFFEYWPVNHFGFLE